jgi:GT2 family glycosyltransferase
MASVTVLIPHWNRRDLMVQVLKQLPRQTHPIEEVLVVDNGSTDGSADAAEEHGARVLRLDRNEGFARAVNRGIAECRTELIALLNNDVEACPDWLEKLVSQFHSPSVWFAAGKLLSANQRDRIDGSFDLLSKSGCAWRAGSGWLDGPAWNKPREICFVSGTASVFRTELFHRMGGLDEEFGSYLEDVEFGLRCATGGFRGVYVPEAVAYHVGSATLGAWTEEHVRLMARNQLLLIARHNPSGWLRAYGWKVLVGQLLWGVLAFRHGAGRAFLEGKYQALRMFRRLRRDQTDMGRLRAVLDDSEGQIESSQQESGADTFWRWYFRLT